jgi:hypothetical protein
MIEAAAPSCQTRFVTTIGDVDRGRVEPGAGPLANDVDDNRCANEPADFVSSPDTAVLHDDIVPADMSTVAEQRAPQAGEQLAQLFVDGVGIQAIRDHDLDVWPLRGIQPRNVLGVVITQALTCFRVREVVIAIRGSCTGPEWI